MLFLAVYNCYCILCWWKLVYTFYSIVGKFKNVKQKVLAQFALNEKPQKYSLEVIVKSQTSDPYVKLFRRYWDTIILFIFCNSFKKKCWFWKLVGLASMYRNRLLFVGTGIGPGWKGCTPGRCPSLLDSGTRESLLFVLPGFAPSTPRYSFSLSLLFERQRLGGVGIFSLLGHSSYNACNTWDGQAELQNLESSQGLPVLQQQPEYLNQQLAACLACTLTKSWCEKQSHNSSSGLPV